MKGEKLTKIRLEQTNRNIEIIKKIKKKNKIKNNNRNNNRELNYNKKNILWLRQQDWRNSIQ